MDNVGKAGSRGKKDTTWETGFSMALVHSLFIDRFPQFNLAH